MLGIKQICQNKPGTDSFKYPALFLGPGKYAQAASNSSLNNYTAFTVASSYNYTDLSIQGSSQFYEFIIMKNNNSSIFSGNDTAGASVSFWGITEQLVFICNGSTKHLASIVATNNHKKSHSTRVTSPIITTVLTGDASSNSYALHVIASNGYQKNNSLVHFKSTGSYTFTNWGTFDTDGFVSAGAYRQTGIAQDSSNANLTSSHGFLRAQLWNSALTDEQILNTVGGDGTVFSMPSYSEGSYPEPNHEWIPVLGNNSTVPDTGSDTAINLTIEGSAKVGYYPARV
ncbi:MAG: hypothetical protein Tp152DCM46671_48 [Prokaryotic dsDNA virus sp.]|nr:MAG: hypothetical protein Tp152DCM46671_48 [Prokaryotic dsDNA virus sp.]|tara:strand:- start:40334 stop:41191 length:858 start_codon:yes stop_codon:yes gene_type:complete